MIRSALLLGALSLAISGEAGPPASLQSPSGPPAATPADIPADSQVVPLIRLDEAISPTTTNYIRRAIAAAREGGASFLIIELDTPGGLLESTHDIVGDLFASPLPVVVYVSPAGARAASAGTFITLAAHVAAMAPSTTIGAASPVTMSPGAQADSVMQRKVFAATESFMETIAERRGRNVEWALSAVREGASVTEQAALELGVIDLVAGDRDELLQRLDGRVVDGDTLSAEGASIVELPRNLAERFLGLIMRPEIMLVLMMIAIYGIMAEVTNPGGIVPGVAGVIALVLLLYASAAMPINTAGYILLVLAVLLFVAEAFTPTFGLLIGAGAVAFFLGSLMLFQDLPEAMELPWGYLVPATLLTAAFFVWIATAGIRAQFAPRRSGVETLVGRHAEVVDAVGPEGGRVFVNGEYWLAVGAEAIPEGEACEIVDIHGLILTVKPVT